MSLTVPLCKCILKSPYNQSHKTPEAHHRETRRKDKCISMCRYPPEYVCGLQPEPSTGWGVTLSPHMESYDPCFVLGGAATRKAGHTQGDSSKLFQEYEEVLQKDNRTASTLA